MAAAPERISIKRRRADEPVDHLLYQSKKQRVANHVFVRLALGKDKPSQAPTPQPSTPTIVSSATQPGIPLVRVTLPGDEIKDFQKYKAAQNSNIEAQRSDSSLVFSKTTSESDKPSSNARRFHLTRDLSTALRPEPSGGIRKVKSHLRPHLPTFIERVQVQESETIAVYAEAPVDRIVRSTAGGDGNDELRQILSNDTGVKKSKVQTFKAPVKTPQKTGRSIHDHPATWDIESDELADELMALALEMDPEAKAASMISSKKPQAHDILEAMATDYPDDYVYETYVRVEQPVSVHISLPYHQSTSFGYLIIDEEEAGLWEEYLKDEDDDDDDWDEENEDSNAEDNPRNEYPDEDISSDDEYSTNLYKYRRGCSDDEQFDTEAN